MNNIIHDRLGFPSLSSIYLSIYALIRPLFSHLRGTWLPIFCSTLQNTYKAWGEHVVSAREEIQMEVCFCFWGGVSPDSLYLLSYWWKGRAMWNECIRIYVLVPLRLLIMTHESRWLFVLQCINIWGSLDPPCILLLIILRINIYDLKVYKYRSSWL